MNDPFDGVLPVDKPAGPTSHDIVARARRALRMKRIGHTGTLDPFATGLLLLCLGRATRIAEYVTGFDKRYTATVRLGVRTDTDDHTGAVVEDVPFGSVTRAAVEAALQLQRGAVLQTPPQYSAKKQSGERAYDMARAGREFTLAPVAVEIYELRMVSFAPPHVELAVHCSSGTYIRAIARDLGAALGVGGHLTALRRTAVGAVAVEQAVTLEQLDDDARVRAALVTPLAAIGTMPRIDVSDDDVVELRHGRALDARDGVEGVVAIAAHEELIAIGVADAGRIRPRKVFL